MDKEYAGSLDIKQYLDLIRNEENESVLLIAVKNDNVQDVFQKSTDSKDEISIQFLEQSGAFCFMKKWNDKGAKIYNYHNHPDTEVARPSISDIINPPSRIVIPNDVEIPTWKETKMISVREDFQRFVSEEFEFEDLGVVAQDSFFSMQQNTEKTIQILKENIDLYKKNNTDLRYL